MKKPVASYLIVSVVSLLPWLFSACGEAGVGINISKNIPFDIPINLPTADIPSWGTEINPPSVPYTFELASVEEFASDLDDLDEFGDVVVNKIQYQLIDISSGEEVDYDNLTFGFNSGSTQLTLFSLTNGTLVNMTEPEESNSSGLENMSDILLNSQQVDLFINLDLAEIPTENLDFALRMYFDITLKIRDGE